MSLCRSPPPRPPPPRALIPHQISPPPHTHTPSPTQPSRSPAPHTPGAPGRAATHMQQPHPLVHVGPSVGILLPREAAVRMLLVGAPLCPAVHTVPLPVSSVNAASAMSRSHRSRCGGSGGGRCQAARPRPVLDTPACTSYTCCGFPHAAGGRRGVGVGWVRAWAGGRGQGAGEGCSRGCSKGMQRACRIRSAASTPTPLLVGPNTPLRCTQALPRCARLSPPPPPPPPHDKHGPAVRCPRPNPLGISMQRQWYASRMHATSSVRSHPPWRPHLGALENPYMGASPSPDPAGRRPPAAGPARGCGGSSAAAAPAAPPPAPPPSP